MPDEKNMNILISINFEIPGINIEFSGALVKTGNDGSDTIFISRAEKINFNTFFGEPIPNVEFKEMSLAYFLEKKKYRFRVVLGESINLSNLPLVGKFLSGGQTVSIDNLAIFVENDEQINIDSNKIKSYGDDTKIPLPKIIISADIMVGGEKFNTVCLPIVENNPDQGLASFQTESKENKSENVSNTVSEPSETNGKWFSINKTIGPVSFKRIGVNYDSKNSKFFLLLDASLAMGPLNLALTGLGIGSSIGEFDPKFALEGLGISYSQGGIGISGALLYDKTDESFTGAAIIKTPYISLSAIGGYQEVNGDASLFIYAVLTNPYGLISLCLGPVFLQLTGIAAGFGYNRGLKVPEVEKIKEFPFVKVAYGDQNNEKDPLKLIKSFKEYIPAVKGEMFLAFGVRFNIQKLIDCFALLIVRMGRKINIDILGVAKIAFPTQVDVPLAQVEMAYKVSFDSGEGAVKVSAVLTPASYIFSKECRLTGGFAFYAWFYGEHAGDFVLSIGGYHPQFNIPSHFPRVPRVGFQWQVIPALSFKGELYCALTPNAIMAGGLLQAVLKFSSTVKFDIGIAGANLSGSICASFSMNLDLFLAWNPLSYSADIGLNIGFEARFRGTARFLMFTKTVECVFSLNLGAELKIWGPPFSGVAHIDWYVVSLTIPFGADKETKKPLDWNEFKKAFLPADNICAISISEGLIRQIETEENDKKKDEYIVNPGELVLAVSSMIPIVGIKSAGIEGRFFGIASMKIDKVEVSQLTLEVKYAEDIPVTDDFRFEEILKSVPAAIWGKSDNANNLDNPGLIEDMLMGVMIVPRKEECNEWVVGSNSEYVISDHGINDGWIAEEKFSECETDQQKIIGSISHNSGMERVLGDFFNSSVSMSLSDNISEIYRVMPQVEKISK